VVGRTITDVCFLPSPPLPVRGMEADAMADALRGRRIDDIGRRGKYLLFALDNGLTLIAHLRMTGALLHRRPEDAPDAYTRAVFSLDDGTDLRFADLRKFGTLELTADPATALARMGVELLSDDFTVDWLRERARKRTAPLKSFLLNQAIAAGMGNIYADESLYEAGLDPRRPVGSLSKKEMTRLHAAVRSVLERGVANRGASFRDYRDADGREGTNQSYVRVFRRTGQPCYACGETVARIKLAGRSTHYCPTCQGGRRHAR
jgi:formamidopyrimidine-DNA glycosylase